MRSRQSSRCGPAPEQGLVDVGRVSRQVWEPHHGE